MARRVSAANWGILGRGYIFFFGAEMSTENLRCARDSNQDPLANRIARIESRKLKPIFKNVHIVKTSQRIEWNLGLRFESCDFRSLRIGAIRSAFGTSKLKIVDL